MKYEYKMVAVPKSFVCKYGIDVETVLATYIEEKANEMAKDGWEFFNSSSYSILEQPGCLGSLFGQEARSSFYNVLVFRRENGVS